MFDSIWTIEELRSMSQHLSFTLVTKNPEDIKKVVEFAVELTKEEFEKHSLDYTEYLEVEEDYLDWYDCFSGMIDFDAFDFHVLVLSCFGCTSIRI